MSSYDFYLHEGNPLKPMVILVHGFGMNGHFWHEADSCYVLGGLATLSVFLSSPPDITSENRFSMGKPSLEARGLGLRLVDDGFSVVTWSQSQPLGPIQVAVQELSSVVGEVTKRWPDSKIFILGHSRGGLIGRLFLGTGTDAIAGLITICSPHHGTSLAQLGRYVNPVGGLLKKALPVKANSKITRAMARMAAFLASEAIAELTPDSDVIEAIQSVNLSSFPVLSIGGTDPSLFSLFYRVKEGRQWQVIPWPEMLMKVLPKGRKISELTSNEGDGLVTAKSAVLHTHKHRNFPCNHVYTAFDPDVYRCVRLFLLQQ